MDFRNKEFLALVYEFISNGSLEDWIKGRRSNASGKGLNILERLNVTIDVACAINYLHHECESPVVHCDLKPSNVLLDKDMTAKVGDFGLATVSIVRTSDQSSINFTNALKGSIGYIPPECGLGEKPSTAGDVYSFGIMLLELFTGKSPTHDSFMEGLSLRKWVELASPVSVEQVVDPDLLLNMDNLCHDDQFISKEKQRDCLITVIAVGLSCTTDSREQRINMRDAFGKLTSVKDALLKPYKENIKFELDE